ARTIKQTDFWNKMKMKETKRRIFSIFMPEFLGGVCFRTNADDDSSWNGNGHSPALLTLTVTAIRTRRFFEMTFGICGKAQTDLRLCSLV
ncbi:MAG: hypothetical protein LC768_15935, partial [Acidobacteria bacterium]|nr:hypothetical protein [Acidobacteriota bacterium]MCA1639790.1 hypothetical protein [Acidobacteriota bacterium]